MKHLSVIINEVNTMSSIALADLLNFDKKEVHKKIRTMFGEDKARELFSPDFDRQGRIDIYNLPELESKMFVAKWDIAYLEKITQFWIDYQEHNHIQVLPENFADACRQLADKHEQLESAIATKAEIGNRREATAMNTASQAVRKANKLEVELDKSKEYSSIKRMEIITDEKFNWRLLKSTAIALDKPIVKIPDPNFEEVNAYHYTVWLEAYGLEIAQ